MELNNYKKKMNKLIYLFVLCVSFYTVSAQSSRKKVLQKEYNDILKDIKKIQNHIEKTTKERSEGVHEIALINTKINKREKLISNIQIQTKVIESELIQRQNEVSCLGEEIEQLKKEYTKLILWLNKNHNSVNKLAFVMEAHSFKEAYHRIQYIKKYGDFRAKQSKILMNQANRIMGKIVDLRETKEEKVTMIEANKQQKKELTQEKVNRDELIKKLDGELSELRKKIAQKNEQAEAINQKIRKMIEDEVRKERVQREMARRKREQRNASSPSKSTPKEKEIEEDFSKTPEGILSNSFRESQGQLPWPVSSGSITSRFGRQPHPIATDLFIDNSGVDIKTSNNSVAKSIYKGEVVRIFEMPTYQTCVMIKHGEYFSVYSYLKSVHVKEGMEVSAGQSIGICGYDEAHGYSLLNLQIWHYQNKQNPQNWLSQR